MLWLLAAACVALLVGWRGALRKSRALGDETERLARNQRQLLSAHTQLKSQSEHLRQLAINDPLTGALNRQGFANDLKQVLEHLSRFHRPLNLTLFDLDNFKSINEQLGHLVGDQALAETAALAESIRAAVVREGALGHPSMTGLSLSLGIAQANPETGYLPDSLFRRADTALYTAKSSGRNRVVLADESLEPPPIVGAATRHLT